MTSRILAIDTASEACSAALFTGGELIDSRFEMLGRGHAEGLVPMIAALEDQGNAEQIYVNIGPGSFTGIRVGLAAAKALGFAWRAPVLGYVSLDLIAAMALAQLRAEDASSHAEHPAQLPGKSAVDVVTRGGHGEWFFASYDGGGGCEVGFAPLAAPQSLSPEIVATNSSAPVIAGSMAAELSRLRAAMAPDLPPPLALELWPDARAANLLAPERLQRDPQAFYARAPDAKLPYAPAAL